MKGKTIQNIKQKERGSRQALKTGAQSTVYHPSENKGDRDLKSYKEVRDILPDPHTRKCVEVLVCFFNVT